MTRFFDVVPASPTTPSLVVRDSLPAYRAPVKPAAPVLRPFSIAAGGAGVVTDPEAAYDEATGAATPPAAAPDDCGCGK